MAETQPVNVICMRWGTKYSVEYVNVLHGMVRRNLSLSHRFVCFTDDPAGLDEGIEHFSLPRGDVSGGVKRTYWNKVSIFLPELEDLEGPTLFLDLDLVVVDSLDPFFSYRPGEFVVIRDWLRPDEGNTSVFRFEIGGQTHVFEHYLAHADEVRERYSRSQRYVTDRIREARELNYWPEEWCRSFKRHSLPPWPLQWFQTPRLPEGAKIVAFHGNPNPIDAAHGTRSKLRIVRPTPWILKHWRR